MSKNGLCRCFFLFSDWKRKYVRDVHSWNQFPTPPPSNPAPRCSLALAPIPFFQEGMVRWLEPWRRKASEQVNNKYQALWGLFWQFVSWVVRAVVSQIVRLLKALHIETTALLALGLDPAWISNTSLGLDLEDRGALERKENKRVHGSQFN